tara:strand:+ start:30 stop:428 length:399 start_codon:yes stop_codon:yes gene_type:complete
MIQRLENLLLLAISVLKKRTKLKQVTGLAEHTNTLGRMSPVDSGEFPFSEKLINNKLIRTFDPDITNEELVWHRDLEDREIIVIKSDGWGYQLDNQLPLPLKEDQELFIPKMLWHRVIKGNDKLVVQIKKLP